MTGLHLPHPLEKSAVIEIPTSLDDAGHIPLRFPAKPEESLCFCSYQQSTIVDSPKEWLDAVSISDRKKALFRLVVDADSELTPEMLEEVQTIAFIQGNDNLEVCLRLERVLELIRKVCS